MRMEKGRGAAAAGQPLYIRAGRLSDPPFRFWRPLTSLHLYLGPRNSRSRERAPAFGHGVFVCALRGVSPRSVSTGPVVVLSPCLQIKRQRERAGEFPTSKKYVP